MLTTNCLSLEPEIMDVLRAFGCEDEEFTHYFAYSDGKFYNCIEYSGQFYDFEDEKKIQDDVEFRRYSKRYCKLAFYRVLRKIFGDLPWGALTGIRPTKLAYAELAEGRDFHDLFSQMFVCKDNDLLVGRILKAQEHIYSRGGQNLYISLPFCPTKCEYCSFITAPIERTRAYLNDYTDKLIKEIYSVKPLLSNIRSIYVGGGTPFVLDASLLKDIFTAVREVAPKNCEFTVEAGRPDTFSPEKLNVCAEFGVTRLCVNPQTFNDDTLGKIGRKHTVADVLSAYEAARSFGFDINLDLIAGLADETAQDFTRSIETAIELNPENVTVHTLSLKSGSKLKEETKRLNVAGITDMINISREKLTAAGYEPYYLYRQKYQAGGLENVGWTKPDKACVYNVDVMEETGDNIALGAGAITKRIFGEENRIVRLASPKDIPTYLAKCDKIISDRLNLFAR